MFKFDEDPQEMRVRAQKLLEAIEPLKGYEENTTVWISALSFELICIFSQKSNGLKIFDELTNAMRSAIFEELEKGKNE
jgi:hypothetical protein